MQLHQLKPTTKHKRDKRVGRGGKRGTTSGRGTKGQKARAGHKIRPALRDVIKKLPKMRGYRFKSFKAPGAVLNFDILDKHFPDGGRITRQALLAKGLVRKIKGRMPKIKILGRGGPPRSKFDFSGVALSKSAIQKSGQ